MSEEAYQICVTLQKAVCEEMVRKAKLGYKAVIADKEGRVRTMSAKAIVRHMKAEGIL